jgi:hypothetical protein
MEHKASSPSLLPYLDSTGARLFLRLPLITEDRAALDRLPCPFQVLIDSDPLTRLYEAHFVNDGGSTIARVFLLVQRDRYRIGGQHPSPITNGAIEDFWQDSLSAYQGRMTGLGPILCRDQIDEGGRLVPLRPLLFCKRQGRFFHPPCPTCGEPLDLCTDDGLLAQAGLSPYSTSLRRYLVCPACVASQKTPEFYVYERDRESSPVLKDRFELFRDFKRLLDKPDQTSGIPCPGCLESGGCYVGDERAVANIASFSFYPFHLFAFEAMSLPALDFAALVAGAGPEELETSLAARGEEGRRRCVGRLKERAPSGPSFLFAGEERWFLEVLYLKLSLLGEVVQQVFSGSLTDRRPDLGFPVDQVWVDLPAAGGLLPSFWNFRAAALALLAHDPGMPQPPPALGHHLLGLTWMSVLLVNSAQDVSQVYRSLQARAAAAASGEVSLRESDRGEAKDEAFEPQNIFWHPGTRTVGAAYRALWKKALDLGRMLLRAGSGLDSPFSKEQFLVEMEQVRSEVRAGLFEGGGVPVDRASDEAIHEILLGISRKWLPLLEREGMPAAAKAEEAPPGPPLRREAEEAPPTVMISPEQLARAAGPSKPKVQPPPKAPREPSRPTPQPPKPPAKAEPEEEEIPATVMISPDQLARAAAPSQPKAPPPPRGKGETKGDVPETVVLSPGARAKMPGPPPGPGLAPAESPKKAPVKKAQEAPDDDFVLKTVFISPEQRTDKDSEKGND